MIAAIVALVAGAQGGEVDRIMARFQERRAAVQSEDQFRRLAEDTRKELERYVRENPRAEDAPLASYRAAETFLWAHDPRGGEARLRRLLEEYPESGPAASARFLRGELLFRLEEEAAARAQLEEFVRLHPGDARILPARLYAATTLQNEKRYDEAAEALRAARREFADREDSWDAMLQLSILYHVQERHEEARRTLEQVIRECPNERSRDLARRHLTEYLSMGQPAPAGRVKDRLGQEFSLEDHRGKVIIVHFFDPAAPQAGEEAGHLLRAWEQFKEEDLRLLGVSIGADRRAFEAYRSVSRPGWTLFLDGEGLDGAIARLFGVRGLPWTVAVDRKGKTRFFNLSGRDLRHAIGKLLAEE